jgi:hypothetical protein
VRSLIIHSTLLFASFAAGLSGGVASAQTRVKAPALPPQQQPGVQKPNVDPTHQAIAALNLKLEALRESIGRQVVVLHFPLSQGTSWAEADNTFPANNQRAEKICKDALGDRYGRVLSRKVEPDMATSRWYFPNVVCETTP